MINIEHDAPLNPQDAADAARLLEIAESLGVDPEDLDDAVHDAAYRYARDADAVDDDAAEENYDEAGRQAADEVNNQGLDQQVSYLVAQYGAKGAEEIIRAAVTS